MDPRVIEHARILVRWSTQVKEGDMVLVRASPEAHDLAVAVAREVSSAGGKVMVLLDSDELTRTVINNSTDTTLQMLPRHLFEAVRASDVYIALSAPLNTMTMADVDPSKMITAAKANKPISDMVLEKRWCGTVHPCRSLAQQAKMSLDEYADFVYSAVLIDWEKESKTMHLLKSHLESHSDIRFIGPETDLYARTENRIWVVSDGRHNMPSGEVFTAPIENTVEGRIYFDVPFLYQGRVIEGVRLRFEDGVVVDYSAEREQAMLKSILEVDDGARRLGEMAIGTNRGIRRYTLNMLFDEKIGDTVHCALGNAYKDCRGTNESAVHVDMVKNMREGEIYAGNELIYRHGRFFYE